MLVAPVKFNCNMLYTGKGDKGTTKTLTTPERIPKNSPVIEALGAVDELNAWLGYSRAKLNDFSLPTESWPTMAEALLATQENLFIIQGELAGAKLSINKAKVDEVETVINEIEKKLSPINSFLIPGQSEASALCDVGRTLARRAERMIVACLNQIKFSEESLAYMNRLSSLLYALARYINEQKNIKELLPSYK